jgi:hypothetical protein
MRLSSEFANAPTQELASQLRQAGVEFFIVDKSRVDTTIRNVDVSVLLEDERFELVLLQS